MATAYGFPEHLPALLDAVSAGGASERPKIIPKKRGYKRQNDPGGKKWVLPSCQDRQGDRRRKTDERGNDHLLLPFLKFADDGGRISQAFPFWIWHRGDLIQNFS